MTYNLDDMIVGNYISFNLYNKTYSNYLISEIDTLNHIIKLQSDNHSFVLFFSDFRNNQVFKNETHLCNNSKR